MGVTRYERRGILEVDLLVEWQGHEWQGCEGGAKGSKQQRRV